jgi:3-methyladenine DNA glycosylase/8-oxoguanine DNA glycosylase
MISPPAREIFALDRPDVLLPGDLALRHAVYKDASRDRGPV